MSNRYILTGTQINRILQVLKDYEAALYDFDFAIYDFVDEIKQEQYIGKSNKSLFDDITDFSTYLFKRELKSHLIKT